MNRRTRTNLLVAAMLVAMLALTLWTRREAETVGPPLVADPAAITNVDVRRDDGAAFAFVRDGDGWRMTAPVEREVAAQRLDGIVNGLATRSRRSYPADAVPLAELGLDPPRATVVLDGAEYAFGGTHPVSGLRYVLHDGELHLVDDLVMFRLQGKAEDW